MREKIGAGSEESWKDRELNLRRQARAKVDDHGKPRTAVKQKAYEMEADKIMGIWTREGLTTLQRRPNMQQRQQSRPPT